MSEIVFRTCAVAFLDILGFQNFIRRVEEPDSEALNEFSRLQEVIRRQLIFTTSDTQQQHLFPSDLGLECIHISDSFILSAPISSDAHPGYSGLVAVSIKAIQLSHQLLGMGFLLRGGISVGNVYRTPKNIFGTGYQDAYNTEAYCAATPRILFHQSAAKALENDHHSGVKTTNLSIIMKEDHQFILDSLNTHWSYVGDDPDFNVLDVYNGYRATIIKNIADATDTKLRAKWEWAAGLFNAKQRDSSALIKVAPINIDNSSRFAFNLGAGQEYSSPSEWMDEFKSPRKYVTEIGVPKPEESE
jgi:hypothetical protein